jgi:TonB family protein
MRFPKTVSWILLLGTSLGIHAMGFAKLNRMGGHEHVIPVKKPTFMEMTSLAKPLTPPSDNPTTPKQPTPKAIRPKVASRSIPHNSPPVQAEKPPVEAETLADFSGTTLTNEGAGSGWASATGNGMAMNGPLGRAGARVTGRHVEGAGQPPGTTTGLVDASDLSRLPEAPPLEEALEKNYPPQARLSGQPGKAIVRLRITAEGNVRDVMVISETATGFGRACRDTLTGSRWRPPFDRKGHPVDTLVNYTCRFEVT